MTRFGYTLMTEQSRPEGPGPLRRRRRAGRFDFEVSSDHYFPVARRAGSRAVRLVGARRGRPGDRARRADDLRDLPDPALPPGRRRAEGRDARGALRRPVHPRPRRGGEPQRARRRRGLAARSTSARTCSRRRSRSSARSSTGDRVTYYGRALPGRLGAGLGPARASRVPIGVAVSGAQSIARFAPLADHLIAVEPDADLDQALGRGRRRRAGVGRTIGQVPICWDPDADAAVARAHEQFRWFARRLEGQRRPARPPRASPPPPSSCGPRTSPTSIPCGPDLDAIVEAVAAFWEAGFTDVAIVQIGDETPARVPRRGGRAAAGEAARGRRLTPATLRMDRTAGGEPLPGGSSVRRVTVTPAVPAVPAVRGLSVPAGTRPEPARQMIGIAGAPGAGKTTYAREYAARLGARAAYLPMDGFHLADVTLDRLGLLERKGAPETFDAWGYVALLRRLRARPTTRCTRRASSATSSSRSPPRSPCRRAGWWSRRATTCCSTGPVARRAGRAGRGLVRRGRRRRTARAAGGPARGVRQEPGRRRRWVAEVDDPNALLVASTRGRADRLVAGSTPREG